MVEGIGDRLNTAFRFGTSNVKSIIIWGIPLLVMIFLVAFCYIFLLFPGTDTSRISSLVILLLIVLLFLVWEVLFIGFICQCAKTLLRGDNVMPTGLESPVRLVIDGVISSLIYLEALIIGLVFLLPGFVLMVTSVHGNNNMYLLSMLLIVLGLIPLGIFIFLGALQIVIYADTGSLMEGLNIYRSIELVISRPVDALVTFGIAFIFQFAMRIVSTISNYCCLGIFTPFLYVIQFGALIHIIVKFYEQCREGIDRPIYDSGPTV